MNPVEDERSLPRSTPSNSLGTIVNLFKTRLGDCRLSGPAIESVLKLAHDFVYELADQANKICNKGGKKTIGNSHVLTALKVFDAAILGARYR